MRASNKRAVDTLLKQGYREILLRTHCKHKDYVSSIERKYACTDYWNLFDGMCFNPKGALTFIQIKTNAWASKKTIEDFINQHKLKAISVNVTNKKGRWEVLTRQQI